MSVLSKVLSIGGLAWVAASVSTVYLVVCAHNQKRVHTAVTRTQRQTPIQEGNGVFALHCPIFSFYYTILFSQVNGPIQGARNLNRPKTDRHTDLLRTPNQHLHDSHGTSTSLP